MQKIYEPFRGVIPSNASVSQLTTPLNLGDIQYYGWKLYYTKRIPTGKTDKKGKPIKKVVIDNTKPFMYDGITQQFQNKTTLASLIMSNVSIKSTIASIIMAITKMQISQQGANK